MLGKMNMVILYSTVGEIPMSAHYSRCMILFFQKQKNTLGWIIDRHTTYKYSTRKNSEAPFFAKVAGAAVV